MGVIDDGESRGSVGFGLLAVHHVAPECGIFGRLSE